MNEIDLLLFFHDIMIGEGKTRETVFFNIDELMLPALQQRFDPNIQLENVQKLADICIANEWLERTTADPYYNYLSLTEAGLQIVLLHKYKKEV